MYSYSERYDPPAPVISISLAAPLDRDGIQVEALIDSGADITVLPADAISRLRLRRVDTTLVSGLERGAREVEVYAAVIGIDGLLPSGIFRILSWDAEYALLGRDVLNRLVAVLNGPAQRLEVRL